MSVANNVTREMAMADRINSVWDRTIVVVASDEFFRHAINDIVLANRECVAYFNGHGVSEQAYRELRNFIVVNNLYCYNGRYDHIINPRRVGRDAPRTEMILGTVKAMNRQINLYRRYLAIQIPEHVNDEVRARMTAIALKDIEIV